MSTVLTFEDLEIWQMARQQALDIHQVYIQELFSKDWELKNQIKCGFGFCDG